MKDLLLPSGYQLNSGHKVSKQVQSGNGWQIFLTSSGGKLLLVSKALAEFNFENGILSSKLFKCCTVNEENFYLLETEPGYELSHIKYSEVPKDFSEAKAFAYAFAETRKLIPDVELSDTVYIEKYSRILVVGKGTGSDDKSVLGRWLAGGVGISADNVDRIRSLSGIESKDQLNEVLLESGIFEYVETHKTESSSHNEFRLVGRSVVEQFFKEHVIDIIENPSLYKNLGIEFPTPFIIHGAPGCGKTYAVEKLVEYLGFPSYNITSNTVGSPYIHETSKKVSEIFENAMAASPSVIIIDEMESFLSNRNSDNSGLHHIEEVNEFLRLIPKAIENKVIIIGMTNQVEVLDLAVTRRGRFDFCIEVEMPNEKEIKELFEYLVSNLPCNLDNNIDDLYRGLYGRQPSDVAFVVKEAGRIAGRLRSESLKLEHFTQALEKLPKTDNKNSNKIGFI